MFGQSDGQVEFVGFDAESEEGCESGVDGVTEAVGEGDDSEIEVDFEVTEGGVGEKKDLMVEGIERVVKVVVEKLDCLGVEGEERAGGQGWEGKDGWHRWRGQICCGEVG